MNAKNFNKREENGEGGAIQSILSVFSFSKKDEAAAKPAEPSKTDEAAKPGTSGIQKQKSKTVDEDEDEDEGDEDEDDEEYVNEEGVEGLTNQQVKGLRELLADEKKKVNNSQSKQLSVDERKDRSDSKASSGSRKTQEPAPDHVMGLKELMAAEREEIHKRKSDASSVSQTGAKLQPLKKDV